ncbi:hypothetical protein WJX74_003251 [Apatococcus lobatus]|uniref:Uncharacterized protein n=1 Tax=Apatococcus lobatus TaxID=904363 RepID=A0AAW1RYB4_9CHLO
MIHLALLATAAFHMWTCILAAGTIGFDEEAITGSPGARWMAGHPVHASLASLRGNRRLKLLELDQRTSKQAPPEKGKDQATSNAPAPSLGQSAEHGMDEQSTSQAHMLPAFLDRHDLPSQWTESDDMTAGAEPPASKQLALLQASLPSIHDLTPSMLADADRAPESVLPPVWVRPSSAQAALDTQKQPADLSLTLQERPLFGASDSATSLNQQQGGLPSSEPIKHKYAEASKQRTLLPDGPLRQAMLPRFHLPISFGQWSLFGRKPSKPAEPRSPPRQPAIKLFGPLTPAVQWDHPPDSGPPVPSTGRMTSHRSSVTCQQPQASSPLFQTS